MRTLDRMVPLVAAGVSGLLLAACGGDHSASRAVPAAASPGTPAASAPTSPTPAASTSPMPAFEAPPAAASPSSASGVPAPAAAPAAPRPAGAAAPAAARPAAAAKAGAAGGATSAQPASPAPGVVPGPAGSGPSEPAVTPGQAAGPAPAEGNGGATDTGVTAAEIKLGSINMEGMAGGNYIIQPIIRAMQGAVASVNDRGGVYGRKLKLVSCDDGPGDATRAKACLKKLAEQEKIFAMLTAATWSSGALHSDLARYELPLVGAWSYANSEWEDPWMFPTHMSMYHEAHNGAIWVRDVIKPKRYGLICLNSPEMQKACSNVREVLDPTGADMVKQIDVEISTPDMSSEVLGFRAADPEHIVHYAIHPAPIIKFMVDSKQQGWFPSKGMSGNHLVAELLGSLFGDWPVNRYWSNTTYNLWGTDYMAMIKKYVPANNGQNHHITQSAVVGVNFFAEAAKRVGPNLTRAALANELRTGGVYDAGPGLDQKFAWGSQRNARELGGRTEYMFKMTSTDTTANDDATPNGWKPDPDKFVLVDDVD